jgi:hypothetical protein
MTTEESLSALLITRRDALLNRHAEALTGLLHPNYIYVNSVGSVFGRDEYVRFYTGAEKAAGQSVTIREIDMKEVFLGMIGTAAFLIVHSHEVFEFEGKTYEQDYRSQHVALQTPEGWLFASGQATPIL